MQQQRVKRQNNSHLINPELIKMALDGEKYENAVHYVNMYITIYDLANSDYQTYGEYPRFYIRDLIEDLKALKPKEREVLEKFFGINSIPHYLKSIAEKDVALKRMKAQAMDAINRLRNVNKMYEKNARFKKVIDSIARKVYDPEGKFTNTTKAKLAHIYYWFVKDNQFMPYDIDADKKDVIMVDSEISLEKTRYPTVGTFISEWENYFSKIPDNDLVADLIIDFLWQMDSDVENKMLRFAELTNDDGIIGHYSNLNGQNYRMLCSEIRELKERIFSNGEWNADCFRISAFVQSSNEEIEGLIKAHDQYVSHYEYDPASCKEKVKKQVLIRSKGFVTTQYPRYGEKYNFVDETEMIFFLKMVDVIMQYSVT